ncbi:GNAT family N-acetyltransferase [Ureibacillus acetophenoni]|uniref:GNAT family acetyltransferase n=1 Tax=Ureibacillus acetophenoni TaxID=614649 RepID=A0A285U5H9_9BACL|nr:GNAT family N-acetyltransferase [Ureibacillus acetophenoni]SOC37092.1 GNAT family acetyltransferase [Ureibacillus acetophenoni]
MKLVKVDEIKVNQIVELWNQCLGNTFPMTEELWIQNTLHDLNLQSTGSVAVLEEEKLVGFVVAKQFIEKTPTSMSQEIGWIQCLLVKPESRGKGIGKMLLQHAESSFQDVKEIRLGRDPWHYFPGVPLEQTDTIKWFERKGYVKESIEIDLVKKVVDEEPFTLSNSNNHFRVLKKEDMPQLLNFLKDVFPGRWHYEAYRYAQLNSTGREFMGFFIDGKLKGFCRMNDSQSPVIAQNVYWSHLFSSPLGGIGPLGIDRTIRGKHFGLDLVKAAVNELMKRGMHFIVIDWTQLETFYGKLGFTKWKEYQTMSKGVKS